MRGPERDRDEEGTQKERKNKQKTKKKKKKKKTHRTARRGLNQTKRGAAVEKLRRCRTGWKKEVERVYSLLVGCKCGKTTERVQK